MIFYIKKLDYFNLIEIKQLRNLAHINNFAGINKRKSQEQMASFDGNWSYGYYTLFKIFSRIPLFWIFIPLFWILKITKLGQYLYLQLAVNRNIVPLHCTNDSCELK